MTRREAIERITELVLDICKVEGQTVVGPVVDNVVNLPVRKPVKLRKERAEKVIGIALTADLIADIFRNILPYMGIRAAEEETASSFRIYG